MLPLELLLHQKIDKGATPFSSTRTEVAENTVGQRHDR